jgi:Ca2+-transporting ATPase
MSITGTHIGGPAGREVTYVKGAPDALLARCRAVHASEGVPARTMDNATRTRLQEAADAMGARGLRVLALAYAEGPPTTSTGTFVPPHISRPGTPAPERTDLVFAGLAGMRDPPRDGAQDAVARLRAAGVRVVMITGDAPATARAVAAELGIASGAGEVLTGAEVDGMSPRMLEESVGRVGVFARTTPAHKLAIVRAWQARGAVVAMTGDGVNDAPALKLADIGVAMGRGGTDVAKEAADVILVDDKLGTLLPAVEEGKAIFANVRNFLAFQLSTAAAALGLITISTLSGRSAPLNAMQILFINIIMDGAFSRALLCYRHHADNT